MKIVKPSFEIWQMPEGAQALSLLELIGRVAYKSEDMIDDGIAHGPCPTCDGSDEHRLRCPTCKGSGKVYVQAREPSSHRFIKMILKAEQRAKAVVLTEKLLHEAYIGEQTLAHDDLHHELADRLVKQVYDFMKENPPHESVIEHCSATVRFTSNRGFTHELVRHRLAAFTQESTRYCNYAKGKFGKEISVTERDFWDNIKSDADGVKRVSAGVVDKLEQATEIWRSTNATIEKAYMELIELGIKPQLARDILPQAIKADIVITANFREWRHIFKMRRSAGAHPDMRELMDPLQEEFQKRIPIIFDET